MSGVQEISGMNKGAKYNDDDTVEAYRCVGVLVIEVLEQNHSCWIDKQ